MWSYAVRLVVASFLIVAYVIARWCYGGQRRRLPPPPPPPPQQTVSTASQPQPQPLSRESKTGIASITFTCESASLQPCAICLEDYKSGDECRRFVKCDHSYHKACIDPWMAQGKRCPLCREPVRGGSVKAPDSLDQVV